MVRKYHPDATQVHFETSDQNMGYGFVANSYSVHGTKGRRRFCAEMEEHTSLDIDWDSIMGEGEDGTVSMLVPCQAQYHAVRMFETTDMPKGMFEALHADGWIVEDGIRQYIVGYVTADCMSSGHKAAAKQYRVYDQWFIDRGAAPREVILIHHGEFNPNLYKVLVPDEA